MQRLSMRSFLPNVVKRETRLKIKDFITADKMWKSGSRLVIACCLCSLYLYNLGLYSIGSLPRVLGRIVCSNFCSKAFFIDL